MSERGNYVIPEDLLDNVLEALLNAAPTNRWAERVFHALQEEMVLQRSELRAVDQGSYVVLAGVEGSTVGPSVVGVPLTGGTREEAEETAKRLSTIHRRCRIALLSPVDSRLFLAENGVLVSAGGENE